MQNDLERIKSMCDRLQATTKRLEKEAILLEYGDDKTCKEVLRFLYDPGTVTGLSDKKITKQVAENVEILAEIGLLDAIEYITQNNTGRDKDIAYVKAYIANNIDYADLLRELFCKSLKTGVDAKTVNKVYGSGFIKTFDVMLAQNFNEERDYVEGKQYIITKKLDGHRCVAFLHENGEVRLFTRTGQSYGDIPDVAKDLQTLEKGYVYDGELTAADEGAGAAQQQSFLQGVTGAVFNKTSSAARKKDTKAGLVFNVFDMLPIQEFLAGLSAETALARKNKLHETFNGVAAEWVTEVEMLYVGCDIQQVNNLYNVARENGWEGLMINIADAPYQSKRTKDLLKVKTFLSADVLVVDIYEGTGRYKGMLGGVTFEFENKDKRWRCDCGSGFSEEERKQFWHDKTVLAGKIIEVQYFEISRDKDGNYSMRFPVFLRIRDDKDEISMY